MAAATPQQRARAAVIAALVSHAWLEETELVKEARKLLRQSGVIEIYRAIDNLRLDGTIGKWKCAADRRIVWGLRVKP